MAYGDTQRLERRIEALEQKLDKVLDGILSSAFAPEEAVNEIKTLVPKKGKRNVVTTSGNPSV